MTSPIDMRCCGGALDVAETELGAATASIPSGEPSRWFPGRYLASVREECGCICVLAHTTPPVHEHFNFDQLDPSTFHQATKASKELLEKITADNKSCSVNDWRFFDAATRTAVEMKLDAPGSERSSAVTTFPARCLPAVLESYWIAELHMGALRAKRVTDSECMQAGTTSRLSDMHREGRRRQAALIREQPFLHDLIVPPKPGKITQHRDGDMLCNIPSNLASVCATLPGSNTSSMGGGLSDSDDKPSPPRRKRRRRAAVQSNSTTQIPGVSVSADGMTLWVDAQGEEGTIRKQFRVLGASAEQALKHLSQEEQDELIAERQLAAQERAVEFLADHEGDVRAPD